MEIEQVTGWAAVAALFFTMAGQAWKQWRDRVTSGIGKFFFVGQVTASTLFLVYSAMKGDFVFVVGNAMVLTASLAGGTILWLNRTQRRPAGSSSPRAS